VPSNKMYEFQIKYSITTILISPQIYKTPHC
jgi:hypothetical protein